MSDYKVAGKGLARIDAKDKALGTARFAADLEPANALTGLVLRSPHPFARVLSVNAREARKIPGVRIVLTREEAPAHRWG
ncbi:MAG: hypothetical protein V3V62_12940, partial [bacterium]